MLVTEIVVVKRNCVTGDSERGVCDLVTKGEVTLSETNARDIESEAVLTKVPYDLENFTETKLE